MNTHWKRLLKNQNYDGDLADAIGAVFSAPGQAKHRLDTPIGAWPPLVEAVEALAEALEPDNLLEDDSAIRDAEHDVKMAWQRATMPVRRNF